MQLTQVFKYSKWTHAEDLIRWGRIRVGTLYDYQDIERHGLGVGEAEEGKKSRYDNPPVTRASDLSTFAAPFVQSAFQNLSPDAIFAQCVFERIEESPNCWLYCLSERLSFRTMDSMRAAYDSCVRIANVLGFFQAICQTLNRMGPLHGGQIIRVKYRNRSQHYLEDDGLPPWALKNPCYSAQEEIRFAYFPANELALKHIDLTIPWLKAFCEPAKDIPG